MKEIQEAIEQARTETVVGDLRDEYVFTKSELRHLLELVAKDAWHTKSGLGGNMPFPFDDYWQQFTEQLTSPEG